MKKKRIHYNPKLTARARELRNNSTEAEILLWNELKRDQLLGFDFHRQKPIDNYIVDFFCYDLMLAIEVDGDSHTGKEKYDAHRQKRIEQLGVRFLRFADLDVRQRLPWVLNEIEMWIKANYDTPLAPPSRGEMKQINPAGHEAGEVRAERSPKSTRISSTNHNPPPSKGGGGGVDRNTHLVKTVARDLGFSYCGISKAEFLEDEAPRLEEWLKRGYQGQMSYLENHFDKRLDPRLLVPGAKSVISLIYNYYPEKDLAKEGQLKIAKYAYGEDYHAVVKDKLKTFLETLRQHVGDIDGRAFVDSAPVHERAWAQKSGLGWIGKNSLLLNRQMGSFFFLAELIIDLELEPDGPIKDYCGTCTACMDACPTEAIPQPYVVDGSKCISYFTIELKGEIPNEVAGKFDNWIFGCDICQDVCPWNRFSQPHREPRFAPHADLEAITTREWTELTEEVFARIFPRSAVKRTRFEGLKRNIRFAQKK
jgi:epoxyqueuosine reductase